MGNVGRRRLLALATALAVAAADLVEKGVDTGSLHHARSAGALALMALVAAALLALVPRLPSRPVAVGGGIAAGGAIGNLVSALVWWGQGIPDPLVVRGVAGGIAFNLADISVLVGDALLLTAAAVQALRNRPRLGQPL